MLTKECPLWRIAQYGHRDCLSQSQNYRIWIWWTSSQKRHATPLSLPASRCHLKGITCCERPFKIPPSQGVSSEYLGGLSLKIKVWKHYMELFHGLGKVFFQDDRLKYEPLLSLPCSFLLPYVLPIWTCDISLIMTDTEDDLKRRTNVTVPRWLSPVENIWQH